MKMFCLSDTFPAEPIAAFKDLKCIKLDPLFRARLHQTVISTLRGQISQSHKMLKVLDTAVAKQAEHRLWIQRYEDRRAFPQSTFMLLIWKSQTENWVSVCLKPDLHNSVSLTADPGANAPLFQCTRATADKIQAEVCVCKQSCVRWGGGVGGLGAGISSADLIYVCRLCHLMWCF